MSARRPRDTNKPASALLADAVGLPPPKGVYEALLKRQAEKKAKMGASQPIPQKKKPKQ